MCEAEIKNKAAWAGTPGRPSCLAYPYGGKWGTGLRDPPKSMGTVFKYVSASGEPGLCLWWAQDYVWQREHSPKYSKAPHFHSPTILKKFLSFPPNPLPFWKLTPKLPAGRGALSPQHVKGLNQAVPRRKQFLLFSPPQLHLYNTVQEVTGALGLM